MPEPSGYSANDRAFLDDFYAECDEYFTELRRALARLEQGIGKPQAGSEVWDLLFRQMHSLKGVLGMAGLEAPERLAHATESYLRALTKEKTLLSEEHLDALSAVTQLLEQVLAAHRQLQPLPDIAPLLERMNRLAQTAEAAPEQSAAEASRPSPENKFQALVHQAMRAGKKVWRFHFTPSFELHERGIDVNSVRRRLRGLGDILYSAPSVGPSSEITFEFLVATQEELGEPSRWNAEGLSVAPVAPLEGSVAPAASAGAGGEVARAELPEGPAYVAPSHVVRVDLGRLDELVRSIGEMVAYRARLESTLARLEPVLPASESRDLHEINYSLGKELRRLRDGLMRLRLVPLAEVFERMSLVVRDLAREGGRKIRLQLKGQENQIDKYLVERLKEPLLHLVRNAISHGLEPPAERTARGKPEALTITLAAATVGETVLIQVRDDGAGIEPEKVRQQAARAGLQVPEPLTPAALLELLCTRGFSTKEEADLGAGRGVGMAVVKNAMAELGGELELESEPGRGTTFSLRLPLTLAIADALLLTVGGQRFALAQAALQEVATVRGGAIQRLERTEFMRHRDGILPLVRLAELFHLEPVEQRDYPVLVLGHGLERVGIVADRVLGRREIIVRALSDPLFKVPAVSGATELGDRQPVLILDATGLLRMARMQNARRMAA